MVRLTHKPTRPVCQWTALSGSLTLSNAVPSTPVDCPMGCAHTRQHIHSSTVPNTPTDRPDGCAHVRQHTLSSTVPHPENLQKKHQK